MFFKRFTKSGSSRALAKRITSLVKDELVVFDMQDKAKNSSKPITRKGNESELIVSLTTYSKRINHVHLVIESIAEQTLKPTKFILWLDQDEFSLDTIPLILKKQLERGLEIKFCENQRSYKKLIPTLQMYPEANIVTIDDDIIYPYYLLERLVRDSKEYPDTVICFRGHLMKYDNSGHLLPYKKWPQRTSNKEPSMDIFPTGVNGVYYPQGVLNSECIRYDIAEQLAPFADDVWFKAMSAINKRPSKVVSGEIDYKNDFTSIHIAQDIALRHYNRAGGGNDRQLKAVFSKYNIAGY